MEPSLASVLAERYLPEAAAPHRQSPGAEVLQRAEQRAATKLQEVAVAEAAVRLSEPAASVLHAATRPGFR